MGKNERLIRTARKQLDCREVALIVSTLVFFENTTVSFITVRQRSGEGYVLIASVFPLEG